MIRVHSIWYGVTEYPDCDGYNADYDTGYLSITKYHPAQPADPESGQRYKAATVETMATYKPSSWDWVEDGQARRGKTASVGQRGPV